MATSNQFPVEKPQKKTYGSLWYNGKRILKDRAFLYLMPRNPSCLKPGIIKRNYLK